MMQWSVGGFNLLPETVDDAFHLLLFVGQGLLL